MFRTQLSDHARAVASARQQAQTIRNEFVAATAKETVDAALETIQAEQDRLELRERRLERVRPVVESILATQVKTDIAINIANLDLIVADMLKNERAFTAQGVSDSITALGSKLGRKPATTEQELRDQVATEIIRLKTEKRARVESEIDTIAKTANTTHLNSTAMAELRVQIQDRKLKLQSIIDDIQNTETRFAAMVGNQYSVSLSEMRQELHNLGEAQRLSQLSHEQLKQEVKQAREVQPPQWTFKQQTIEVLPNLFLDRGELMKLPLHHDDKKPDQLSIDRLKRRLDKRFGIGMGNRVVTAILSGADNNQIQSMYRGE